MYQHRLFTKRLTDNLLTLIGNDLAQGISPSHKTTTGHALISRLSKECNLNIYRTEDNVRHVRSLYSNLRYFYDRMDRSQ